MKRIIIWILGTLLIVVIIIFCGYLSLLKLYKTDFDRFTYDSGKREIIKYLKENKSQLESIAIELYESKSSNDSPYKKISYASYCKNNSLEKSSFVKFNFDSQGFLGGQYYGLIYSQGGNIYDGKDIIIYDEKKETGEGNNIFIREKIADNWYYYYDDYDGKIKKTID